jgi:acyl-CoA thioesterase
MFKAVLYAKRGTLVGGVTTHSSVWFDRQEDAENWLATVIEINEQAGRHLGNGYIINKTRVISQVEPVI